MRLLVDNPDGVPELLAGHCGTVVCCNSDNPALPMFVSWDNWGQGNNVDEVCDDPPAPYPDRSGWWVGCDDLTVDAACGPCPPPPPPADPMPSDGRTQVPLDTELCWNTAPELARMIYGADDRLDVFEVSDPSLLAAADSTVALVVTYSLRDNGNGTYSLPTGPSLAQGVLDFYGLPLCQDEPFRDQPLHSFCSGVLVGRDLVATAGHCVVSPDECAYAAFVFGCDMQDATTPVLTFPASDVYFCDSIVERVFETQGADWGIIRLDRPVSGHSPLPIRCSGKVPDSQPLVMMGHPMGLPTKIAGGATVRDNTPSTHFDANVDAFVGNSGSGVFNAATLEVEGLLVRGNEDFDASGDCVTSNWCPDSGCTGPPFWESITRATEFAHLVCGQGPEYDVFFGPCGDMRLLATTTEACWMPPQLEPQATYCWQVIARDECGDSAGPVWSFETVSPLSIVTSDPPNCAIDARQPSEPNGADPAGWDSVVITFDGDTSAVTKSDFQVQTSPPGDFDIEPWDNNVTLQLSRRITLQDWTCITYIPSQQQVCLSHLPGDVTNDRTSAPSDILRVIDCLNRVSSCEQWQCDVDRSDLCGPPDILRVIDLLNGAGAYAPWLNVSMGECPSGP